MLNEYQQHEITVMQEGETLRYELGEKSFKISVTYEGGREHTYQVVYWVTEDLDDTKCIQEFKTAEEALQFVLEESNRKPGRPPIGETKKVSITLAEGEWKWIENLSKVQQIKSLSEYFRLIHTHNRYDNSPELWGKPLPIPENLLIKDL